MTSAPAIAARVRQRCAEKACAAAVLFVVFLISPASVAFGQVDPQFEVNHTPYLQLGDASLGSLTDQLDILWQTIPARGGGTQDSFRTEYRQLGSPTWIDAGTPGTLATGVDNRINHFVSIPGLAYDTEYEYRVVHERDAVPVTTYQDTFRSRLAVGDNTPFTFATYGDSAGAGAIANFQSVQGRINQLDTSEGVAFSVLLGDNAYNQGSHPDYDYRFDPDLNPQLTQYNASHIEYPSIGNHDNRTLSAQPYRENYSVPLNGTAVGETLEENYSFDYGNVHFATFDSSNSVGDATRLDNQLDWLVADMNASDAQWKIAFVHFPVAGSPDKGQSPAGNYYQQVVSRLLGADVDLFMAGHSHLYHWTYPLLGQVGGEATFVLDTDKEYAKGAGLVQLVSGVGGRSLRSGDFAPFPFDAAGYSTDTVPAVEFGFSRVDVTLNQLTVSYIAADDGAFIDSFTISTPEPSTVILLATTAVCLLSYGWRRRRQRSRN
jgi:hypothetical protein